MRRIVTFNRITADGYFSTPDGDLSWAVPDDQLDREAVGHMPGGDTILFGRRTYEMFESFWPNVLNGPRAPDPHTPGRQSAALHEMAVWIDAANKIVFSKTRKDVRWNNSSIRSEIDPSAIEAMKRGPGKDMLLFGSGSIATELTRLGLIDEYQFVISPLFLGGGRSLLGSLPAAVELKLLEARPYASGNVLLRYGRG